MLKSPADDKETIATSAGDDKRGLVQRGSILPNYFGGPAEVPFFFRADEEEERALAEIEREGL